MTPQEAYRRKANNALGVMLICGLFFAETAVADHSHPNPASRAVWTMLGLMVAISAVAWFVFRRKARQAASAEAGVTGDRVDPGVAGAAVDDRPAADGVR
jgi:peptidoglycan/LPS O-acetylase OafA/YrhL